ncbi:hypothetical protein WKW50_24580 [Ochrobactrum sp. GPK 3]|uniref:hypothetical protein n=1 Tax=Brucella sp. 22210 TaxID=3453892 RepID=UPI0031384B09
MKKSNLNVVVEYKNRRARKAKASVWGSLDLKSIAREVETDTSQYKSQARKTPDLTETNGNMAEPENLMPPAEPVIANLMDNPREPEDIKIEVAEPREAAIKTEKPQDRGMPVEIIANENRGSGRNHMKKAFPQKQKLNNQIVGKPDIQAELSSRNRKC